MSSHTQPKVVRIISAHHHQQEESPVAASIESFPTDSYSRTTTGITPVTKAADNTPSHVAARLDHQPSLQQSQNPVRKLSGSRRGIWADTDSSTGDQVVPLLANSGDNKGYDTLSEKEKESSISTFHTLVTNTGSSVSKVGTARDIVRSQSESELYQPEPTVITFLSYDSESISTHQNNNCESIETFFKVLHQENQVERISRVEEEALTVETEDTAVIKSNYHMDVEEDVIRTVPSEENNDEETEGNMERLCRRCWNTIAHNRFTYCCLRIPTIADAAPAIPSAILSNGKWAFLGLIASCIIFDLIVVMPAYIVSLLITETGVYISMLLFILFVGRFIIRLIAFPGASHRISGEVESEFSKYSLRMLENSAECLIDVCTLLLTTYNNNETLSDDDENSNEKFSKLLGNSYGRYDIIPLWSKAGSYKSRVLGMFYEVLHCLLDENGCGEEIRQTGDANSTLSQYGNNRLVGDIGNLSTISLEAKADGETLKQILKQILDDLDHLEESVDVLQSSVKSLKNKSLTTRGVRAAQKLMISATELKDFLPKMKSQLSLHLNIEREDDTDDDTDDDESQRLQSSGNKSFVASVKSGVNALIRMLDPIAHPTIFGLDVLRGSVIARYRGARQLWVKRPKKDGGGMIDVLHIPSQPVTADGRKAVLFCNPNAGLVEVSTGMSIVGGNATDGSVAHNVCWADFYIENGYDIFLFNYCGYGRSHAGDQKRKKDFSPGIVQVIKRILTSLLFDFKPSPDSVKADALAVALHIIQNLSAGTFVIHGESIGGMSAASTARNLSNMHLIDGETSFPNTYPTVLICDRTFCNLNAVAQHLVGRWTGTVIPILTPFWSTDVAGDFAAANCKKIVAQDAADVIIDDSASLKAGLALAKESGKNNTAKIAMISDEPLQYRMADWEDVGVMDSKYVKAAKKRQKQAPVWPADKHIDLEEAIHFAACARRIGKMATVLKKTTKLNPFRLTNTFEDQEEGIEITTIFSRASEEDEVKHSEDQSHSIIKLWETLSRCDGMTGLSLGIAVKGGTDSVLTWLFAMVTFGCQQVSLSAEIRKKKYSSTHSVSEITVDDKDFDVEINEHDEDEILVKPLPLPEVVRILQKIAEEKGSVEEVRVELHYCIKMLEYIMTRMTTQPTISNALHARHFRDSFDGFTTGCFLNLTCGHNNQYSENEKDKLLALLSESCEEDSALA